MEFEKRGCYFLSEEEIEIVLDLLIIAGYTKEQNERIKKKITENNIKIIELQKVEIINKAKDKYLSNEEKDILSMAEKILSQKNSCDNVLFSKVYNSYNYVVNALVDFYKNTQDEACYNDDAELMLMFIEELKSDIESFNYSNYKLMYTKKSN